MQIHRVVGLAALLAPASLLAQSDTLGTVAGSVYDSVARRPAAGAVVQMVPKGAPSPLYSDTADARGRYEIRGVPAGSYIIGFDHPGVDSLNVLLPPMPLDVRARERTRADLAIPSPQRIVAALCGIAPGDSIGAIVGFLRDAHNANPVDSGLIVASWNEVTIAAGGISFEPVKTQERLAMDGSFVLCGVVPGGEASLVGVVGADSSGAILARIPEGGLLRRDLSVGGTLNVRGVVLTDAGRPAANAEVLLTGRARSATTDSAGVFRVFGARGGSQTIETRALGYVPERQDVTLTAGRDTSFDIRITSLKKMLDTIRVVAERVYWADRGGFTQRQRRGFGHFFDQNAIQRRNPSSAYDLLTTIPGVQISRSGFSESVTMRGTAGGNCIPTLYVDGMRMAAEMVQELRFLVPVDQIGGLEVYTRGSAMPAQFSNFDGCGSIVVWTQAPPASKRRR